VQIFVSIYGRHLTKLFLTTRFLSEMPAEEATSERATGFFFNLVEKILGAIATTVFRKAGQTQVASINLYDNRK
jgi:hypothetical protein